MPVNEYVEDEVPAPTKADRVVTVVHQATGATDRMPVRVIVLFITAIACTALAPIPFSLIGAAAIVLLALDTSLHRR
jgi:hypothetical protein